MSPELRVWVSFTREASEGLFHTYVLLLMMSSGEDFNENYIKELISESSIEHDEFIDYQKFVKLLISAK